MTSIFDKTLNTNDNNITEHTHEIDNIYSIYISIHAGGMSDNLSVIVDKKIKY